MTYIIEDAHLLKGKATAKTDLLIDGEVILTAKPSLNRYKHIRMSADAFIMTPTHVLLDSNLLAGSSFQERKNYYSKNFLMHGSTTVLTSIEIHFESQLEMRLKQVKRDLIDCPLDYVIGVRIPISLLNPSFIRKCKRAKIPAIFVDITDIIDLVHVPWGWVKEALFPYNSLLIPVFNQKLNKREKQLQIHAWGELMKQEKLNVALEEVAELSVIPRKVLMKTGIFPHKANLSSGGELSYNLYHKTPQTIGLDEKELFDSQSSQLAYTIHKGKVVRAGSEVYFRPGMGENVIINTPGFFTDNH